MFPTYSESYDQALRWLVTARYRDAENAEIVMSLVGDFAEAKGKKRLSIRRLLAAHPRLKNLACQTPRS